MEQHENNAITLVATVIPNTINVSFILSSFTRYCIIEISFFLIDDIKLTF